jgi:hypothetical protein
MGTGAELDKRIAELEGMNALLRTVITEYEAALKTAFPEGAWGDAFDHWNDARIMMKGLK